MIFGLDPNMIKLWLVSQSGLAKDALHIYVGMLLFVGIALTRARRLRSKLAWGVVFCAAIAGELMDGWVEHHGGLVQPPGAHWHDIWNTLFWPTALFLLARSGALGPPPVAVTPASGDDADEPLE